VNAAATELLPPGGGRAASRGPGPGTRGICGASPDLEGSSRQRRPLEGRSQAGTPRDNSWALRPPGRQERVSIRLSWSSLTPRPPRLVHPSMAIPGAPPRAGYSPGAWIPKTAGQTFSEFRWRPRIRAAAARFHSVKGAYLEVKTAQSLVGPEPGGSPGRAAGGGPSAHAPAVRSNRGMPIEDVRQAFPDGSFPTGRRPPRSRSWRPATRRTSFSWWTAASSSPARSPADRPRSP
jgi:hypothetical protein